MKILLTNRSDPKKAIALDVWDAMGLDDVRKVAAHYGYNASDDVAVRLYDFEEYACSETKSMQDFESQTPNNIKLISIDDWWAITGRSRGYKGILDKGSVPGVSGKYPDDGWN